MRGVVVMLGCFAAGCLGPGSHPCSNADQTKSWLCPANLSCAQAPTYCGAPGLIEPCVDKQELDACMHDDGTAGACHGGVCEACTPTFVGCAYHGWTPMTSNVTSDLMAVWVAGPHDAFAAGADATMLHYDGVRWRPQPVPDLPPTAIITGLWGAGPTDVYAVANKNQIVHYDGSVWALASMAPKPLQAITGAGGVVTAVGLNGTIATFDGTTWTSAQMQPLGFPGFYFGASASGPDNVFAAGSNGWIARFHNGVWDMSRASSGLPNMNAVWASTDEAFAVGDAHPYATIYHFAAGAWTTETITPALYNLLGVWAPDPSRVFASGQGGVIYLRTNAVWSKMMTPPDTAPDLHALGGSSATDIFAVGGNGAIWHYSGD